MWIASGTALVGRYQVGEPLPGTSERARWRAVDRADGGAVEIVAPIGSAALRPGAAERLARALDGLPEHPAILPQSLLRGPRGEVAAVRPALQAAWEPGLRLSADEVRALAAWLGPAVLASGAQLGEGLTADDLVVDPAGVVRLAPSGLVRADSAAHLPRHRAPELAAGGIGDGRAALYGLGALLFRALTGQEAVVARSLGDLSIAKHSPLRAAALVAGLPADVDALLAGLLSTDPDARVAALQGLPEARPVTLSLPPARLAPRAPSGLPAPRPAGLPATARRDLALPPYVVTVSPVGLHAGQLRRLAAWAGVPSSRLQGWDAPVVVGGAATAREAEALAGPMRDSGLDAAVADLSPPWGRGLLALALALAGAGSLLVGALLFPFLIVAIVLLGAAGWLGATAWSRARLQARLRESAARLREGDARPLAEVEGRLSSVRRGLLTADLPDPMRVDLLSQVDELEDQLAQVPPQAQPEAEALAARAEALLRERPPL